jgi:hypothetical protein
MPGATDPVAARAHLAGQLREQARACAAMGSPLYGRLLQSSAADVEAGGPCWDVLAGHVSAGRGGAVALRFMAAVHRLVLTGGAEALAAHYPSVGGVARGDETWEAFRATVAGHVAALAALAALPCQTNEVGRAAGLCGGFLEVVARTGLPLKLLELGASAGLNLRWDRFRYTGGGGVWGPVTSPVDLGGLWTVPPPGLDVDVTVVSRRGCDARPVDPASEDGRLALRASVWADQTERLARLDGAIALVAEVTATVDAAPADRWLPPLLARPERGVATVVYHSVFEEYLPAEVRDGVWRVIADAGERASAAAPLAWLRLEPASALREHAVTLTVWPGGEEKLLARCGSHGSDVVWLDG